MTDSHLRELERRFRASSSVEDEAAFLRARTQAGGLTEERLRLAAYCGHRASAEVLGAESLVAPGELEEWVHGLEGWGREVCVRAACAAGRLVLEAAESPPIDLLLSTSDALKSARAWLECPCETHRGAATALLRTPVYGPDGVFKLSDRIAKTVAVPGTKKGSIANETFNALFEAATWIAGHFESFRDPILLASLNRVRAAAGSELVSWALGDREAADPATHGEVGDLR